MRKFLDKFHLNIMQELAFESFIFGMADAKVKGYHGGQWESQEVGGVVILMIPGEGEHTMDTAFSTETGDRLTISAAFTALVVNWWWNRNADKLSDKQNFAFEQHYFAMRRLDKEKHGINVEKYFNITD